MLKDIFAEFVTRLEKIRRLPEAQQQRSPQRHPDHADILKSSQKSTPEFIWRKDTEKKT